MAQCEGSDLGRLSNGSRQFLFICRTTMSRTGNPLIVIGAIGNCLDIADAVKAQREAGSGDFALAVFLDDDPARQGQTIAGLPVLGPVSKAASYPDAALDRKSVEHA